MHLIVLLVWPFIASLISFLTQASAFASIVLFLVIPCVYLAILRKSSVIKAVVFSLITSVPFIIAIDYVAHINKQWIIPYSILPARLFGIVSIEVVAWAFFLSCFMIMFYEYFSEPKKKQRVWGSRMIYLGIFFVALLGVFIFLLHQFPFLLYIPYFYFWFGFIFLFIPSLIELIRRPKLYIKIFPVGIYFFVVTFIYEITALKLGWWLFPGKYLGWVTVLGVGFPFEEMFFWLMVLAIAAVSYYEFFDDDEK